MRKWILPTLALGLLATAVALVWRVAAPDPWASLPKELKDPASVWAQSLRSETALSDLERFRQAPAYRIDLEYIPNERRLTGQQAVHFTNATERPIDTLYAISMARAWGIRPPWALTPTASLRSSRSTT